MRNDRRNWTENLIAEAETAAKKGHMKTVYDITRVLGNKKKGTTTTTIKDKDGKILSSLEERKKWWK